MTILYRVNLGKEQCCIVPMLDLFLVEPEPKFAGGSNSTQER